MGYTGGAGEQNLARVRAEAATREAAKAAAEERARILANLPENIPTAVVGGRGK